MRYVVLIMMFALGLVGCAGPEGVTKNKETESAVDNIRGETPMPSGRDSAVMNLELQAQEQLANGNADGAASLLERALRIDPANAGLWHRLAQVRLVQGRLQQAAGLAAKSNTLARDDLTLKAANDELIKQVNELQP